jgi:type III pantothenate kinase
MSVSICFDFGNTRLKAAIFNQKELVEEVYFENGDVPEINTLLDKWKPSKTILSSVIHHDKNIESLLSERSKFHLLGSSTKINFTTPVGKPETIGADRLALVAAAVDLFPNQHNLAIALGTCITYNFVNIHHESLG